MDMLEEIKKKLAESEREKLLNTLDYRNAKDSIKNELVERGQRQMANNPYAKKNIDLPPGKKSVCQKPGSGMAIKRERGL